MNKIDESSYRNKKKVWIHIDNLLKLMVAYRANEVRCLFVFRKSSELANTNQFELVSLCE